MARQDGEQQVRYSSGVLRSLATLQPPSELTNCAATARHNDAGTMSLEARETSYITGY